MPKKKKNGLSPSRAPLHAAEYGSGSESRAHGANGPFVTRPDSSYDNSGSTQFRSGQLESQSRDEIIQSMQEMFSHLDSEVIYMVLSEADFKVDNAMDSLLELSDAAEVIAPPPPPVSGFEQAAALLGTNTTQADPLSETAQSFFSNQPASQAELSPNETHLTEEFDALIDKELQTLTSQQSKTSLHPLMSSIPLSSLPPPSQSIPLSLLPLTPQTQLPAPPTLPEQAEQASYSDPGLSEARGGSSPVNELSFGGVHIPETNTLSLDFSHLTLEASSTEPRPSAFQVYCRPDQLRNHAAAKQYQEALRTPAMFWNTQAAEFHLRAVGPTFITPVIPNPTPWSTNPIPAAQWLAHGPIRQAPLKPSATVPESWTLPPRNRLILEGQLLVLLRGAPGSGKTTLANAMLVQNPGGVVLSTDDYFTRNGQYHFEPNLLGEAHEWNHQRAKEAFEKGQSPIIIDNTNMQCWEMKPYVAMAQKHRYKVLFREPDTWWKTKPRELEKRTRHQVTKEKIRRILERYDRFVSVQSIMNSQRPEPVTSVVDSSQTETEQPQQSFHPGLSHPDIVGDSGLSKLNTNLSSSLPDVSSVSQSYSTISAGEEEGEMGSYSSKESVLFHENILEGSGTPQSDLLDTEGLDLELNACLVDTEKDLGNLSSGTTEEFVVSVHEKFLEPPVAFSELIAQHVRRDGVKDRNALGTSAIDQPVNFDPSFDSPGQDEEGCEGETLSEDKVVWPELLDFVGDWPLESHSQRQGGLQNSENNTVKNTVLESSVVEHKDNTSADEDNHSDTDKLNTVEFQKLVDLLQCGIYSSPGFYQGPAPSKETTLNSPSIGGKEGNMNLETVVWPELPDCVLERKFTECTDPCEDYSNSSSPSKQRADPTEQSNRVSAEKNTQDEVEQEDNVLSEDKCRLSPNVQETLCSKVGVDSESSLERRRGLSRRVGKSCKLALTFTNQSPTSPCSQSPVVSHLHPDLTPTAQPPSLPVELCSSASSQTQPQDFALLWRIDQKKCSELDSDLSICGVVLEGNSLRFMPKTSEQESACQQGVPYRVVHEKGSQVDDNDFRESNSKNQNLEILSRHFRCVSIDILEDLYEKCHQDIEWTTNLLLDSGERLCKEDDEGDDYLVPEEESCKSSIEPSETVMGLESVQARPVLSDDSSNSSGSSISLKSQETNISDVSQADDDWTPGQSSQSEAEGSDEASMTKEKCKPKTSFGALKQPTEGTEVQLEVTAANVQQTDNTGQQGPEQEEAFVTEGEKVQCLEEALKEWSEEEAGEKEKEDEETGAEVNAITQSLLYQIDQMERKEEEERKERERERRRTAQGGREPSSMDIQTLELKLPTELALQLTELFGPVGVSPGAFSSDDCAVQIDLNLAKLLHQKWKETIQEKHRQAALSYQLIQESPVHWGESQGSKTRLRDQLGLREEIPFMDHWSASCAPVSLRDIMIEEQVMQDSMEKSRSSRKDLDKKDGAAKLKENQLFSMFPSIDRHFLRDIFRDHNYSLEQTELFLHTLLDDGPVKNVVAPEPALQRNGAHRTPSKERRWKLKDGEVEAAQFQDSEDPEYEDFRTEATLQRRQQIECFNKAAEAHRQGRKDVASFYAQQGHMHGDKMREANHRAAMQIFQRVNASLLPQNILDLHGLHVDEALHHLSQVLTDKNLEFSQGLCPPQLSIITGRGNRSQGGVARIRPAVLDYLKNHHYSFAEPKTGLVLVTLH
ncbi:NEDD4-binding protein 2 [Sinocyclocheilus grahami]|uniref:Smr domain-containing protein n=1 Tax=Sinocyclocheilus grahami TaxID=75366 RepID=A0A672NN47_SINGR|nr:PREDICTED: NEDD4-binding protein 2 [Sinocyclocheilus grahami]